MCDARGEEVFVTPEASLSSLKALYRRGGGYVRAHCSSMGARLGARMLAGNAVLQTGEDVDEVMRFDSAILAADENVAVNRSDGVCFLTKVGQLSGGELDGSALVAKELELEVDSSTSSARHQDSILLSTPIPMHAATDTAFV